MWQVKTMKTKFIQSSDLMKILGEEFPHGYVMHGTINSDGWHDVTFTDCKNYAHHCNIIFKYHAGKYFIKAIDGETIC